MVRFIFICMGVVALSVLSIAGQFIFSDIEGARNDVMARNQALDESTEIAALPEASTPEILNNIETSAGFDPNDKFSSGFSDVAPKGLEDDAQTATVLPVSAQTSQAN